MYLTIFLLEAKKILAEKYIYNKPNNIWKDMTGERHYNFYGFDYN